MSSSDFLFDRASCDGLRHGPVQGFDQPGIAGQPDFLGSFVDAFYEFVGHAEVDVFRHGKHDSTCTSNIENDSVLL